MITSGAQIRAARGFLGWSQQDLARAAGLHPNAIRHWEAQHAREVPFEMATGYVAERITIALLKAGLELWHDPPGVRVNPDVYNPNRRPPILQRWERHWKPDSKAGKQREHEARFARMITNRRGMTVAQGVDWYREWRNGS